MKKTITLPRRVGRPRKDGSVSLSIIAVAPTDVRMLKFMFNVLMIVNIGLLIMLMK